MMEVLYGKFIIGICFFGKILKIDFKFGLLKLGISEIGCINTEIRLGKCFFLFIEK